LPKSIIELGCAIHLGRSRFDTEKIYPMILTEITNCAVKLSFSVEKKVLVVLLIKQLILDQRDEELKKLDQLQHHSFAARQYPMFVDYVRMILRKFYSSSQIFVEPIAETQVLRDELQCMLEKHLRTPGSDYLPCVLDVAANGLKLNVPLDGYFPTNREYYSFA